MRNSPGMNSCLIVALAISMSLTSSAQEPKNLQVLPKDIQRDSLISIMRGFSFALGVRCQYCHVGGDGISFEGVEFDRDDDPDKVKARFMIQMTNRLNEETLPRLPFRDVPNVRIECKTCHRGRPRPVLLKQELRMIIEQFGVDSAIARYRELRSGATMSGKFDFREWETNTLAEDLAKEGRLRDAIAVYRLNEEFFDKSFSIKYELATLYEEVGDKPEAIKYYKKALMIIPDHTKSLQRLEVLQKQKP